MSPEILCNFYFLKVPEWPTEEIAKILSTSCSGSDNCSEKLFSSVLNDCINSENEMEDYLDSVGSSTEFRDQTHKKDKPYNLQRQGGVS